MLDCVGDGDCVEEDLVGVVVGVVVVANVVDIFTFDYIDGSVSISIDVKIIVVVRDFVV